MFKLSILTTLLLLGAWINWLLPIYIPTWPTGADVVFQNIKSPTWRLDLETNFPLLLCSKEVLGIFIPSFLWQYWVSPLQSNVLGPVAPHTYFLPKCFLASSTNLAPIPVPLLEVPLDETVTPIKAFPFLLPKNHYMF